MDRREFIRNVSLLSLIPFVPRGNKHFKASGSESLKAGTITEVGYRYLPTHHSGEGTLLSRKLFSPRTCMSGDKYTITWTIDFK